MSFRAKANISSCSPIHCISFMNINKWVEIQICIAEVISKQNVIHILSFITTARSNFKCALGFEKLNNVDIKYYLLGLLLADYRNIGG